MAGVTPTRIDTAFAAMRHWEVPANVDTVTFGK
jgi:hypothetical protein